MNKNYILFSLVLVVVAAFILFRSATQNTEWPPTSIENCAHFPPQATPYAPHTTQECYAFFLSPATPCTDEQTEECLGGLAVQRNDSTLCEILRNTPAGDGCLFLISQSRNSTNDCGAINNTAVRENCYEYPSGGGSSSGASSNVNPSNPQEQIQIISADPPETANLTTLCIEITEPELRSQCFMNTAITEKDPLRCEGTEGTYVNSGLTFYYKYSCYYYSSIAALSSEYCSRILVPVAYISENECLQLTQES